MRNPTSVELAKEISLFRENLKKTKPNYQEFANKYPHIVVIDLETSGLMPSIFDVLDSNKKSLIPQIIELAAIVIDTQSLKPICHYSSRCAFEEGFAWSAEAEAIHKITQEELKIQFSLYDLLKTFEKTMRPFVNKDGYLYMACHNPCFDQVVLSDYLNYLNKQAALKSDEGCHFKIKHRVLDGYTAGVSLGYLDSTSQKRAAGLDQSFDHSALGDAKVTAALLINYLEKYKSEKI